MKSAPRTPKSERSNGQPVAYGFAPGRFDMGRMKEALAQPKITPPRGMSRDEIIAYICSHAPSK